MQVFLYCNLFTILSCQTRLSTEDSLTFRGSHQPSNNFLVTLVYPFLFPIPLLYALSVCTFAFHTIPLSVINSLEGVASFICSAAV